MKLVAVILAAQTREKFSQWEAEPLRRFQKCVGYFGSSQCLDQWGRSCCWHLLSGKVKVKSLSHVRLFATPWAVAYQAPQSMEFSRQQYWSGLPFPSPGDLPNPGIEPGSPTLQTDTLPSEPFFFFCNGKWSFSLISLWDLLFLVYRNVRDFCVLTLYPATLPNSDQFLVKLTRF